ncbi:MAG: hypothetical protein U0872_01370 [Planctomycetaceae bacterium]
MIDYIHLNPVRRGLVTQAKIEMDRAQGGLKTDSRIVWKPDPVPGDWLEEGR